MYEHPGICSFQLEAGYLNFCCMAHFLPLGIRSVPSVTALSLSLATDGNGTLVPSFGCACYRPALLVQTVFPSNKYG